MRAGHRGRDDDGVILVAVLALLGLLAAVALGGALVVGPEPLVAAAFADRVRLERAADMALRLAMQPLADGADWQTAPALLVTGVVDGAPGPRPTGRGTVDLVRETAVRTCGRPACDDTAIAAPSEARPFGASNPRWRLVLHAPIAAVHPAADAACACYLAAWIADDPADADGDPWADAPAGTPGHHVVLLRGAAFGPAGVAEVEALVARNCTGNGAADPCEPGIRVQSWQLVRDDLP
jgi:hypothetical protein